MDRNPPRRVPGPARAAHRRGFIAGVLLLTSVTLTGCGDPGGGGGGYFAHQPAAGAPAPAVR